MEWTRQKERTRGGRRGENMERCMNVYKERKFILGQRVDVNPGWVQFLSLLLSCQIYSSKFMTPAASASYRRPRPHIVRLSRGVYGGPLKSGISASYPSTCALGRHHDIHRIHSASNEMTGLLLRIVIIAVLITSGTHKTQNL